MTGERDSDQREASAVLSGPAALSAAVSFARSFGARAGLSLRDRARLCIVVEEAVANLLDHAAAGREPPRISLDLEPALVRLVLTDSGPPFDPRIIPPADLRRDESGGAGLALIRAWSSVVDYSTVNGGNRLEIILPLDGAGTP